MTFYARSAYGPNTVPWVENEDHGWGPYYWPQGVPANLLGITRTSDGTALQVRKELVPLLAELVAISEQHFGYLLHTPSGGFTGGYDNRPIAGTSTPSAHSRARTVDIRAVDNPQSWTFQSTWPPDLLAIWVRCRWYWGGYYVGVRYDTMHLTYCGTPAQVAGDLALARSIRAKLAGTQAFQPAPVTPPAALTLLGALMQTSDTYVDSYVYALELAKGATEAAAREAATEPLNSPKTAARLMNYLSALMRDSAGGQAAIKAAKK